METVADEKGASNINITTTAGVAADNIEDAVTVSQ